MATQPQVVKPRRNWTEIKSPEQFQFTNVGQTIEGVLLSLEPVEIKGKQTVEFLFRLEDGDRITCLETADLRKKILAENVGYPHQVRYERDDASFQKQGQSAMKVFKVLVDKTAREQVIG